MFAASRKLGLLQNKKKMENSTLKTWSCVVARPAHRKMTILSSYVSAYWKMKRELDGASSALYFRDMHEAGSKKHEDFSRHLAGHEKRTSKLVAQMARLSDRLTVIKEGSSDA